MALPDLDIARVQRWCAARVPEHARHQVRVECQIAPRHLTIVERRSLARGPRPGMDKLPDRTAALHHRGQDLDPLLARPQRFHIYDLHAWSNRVEDLLNELDRDPTCIFWG